MDLRFLVLSSFLIVGATLSISPAEHTAHCKIKWLFGISCSNVSERLVSQIRAWQISRSCLYAGEQCSYQLVSSAPDLIKATHTSPRTKKVNDLQFLVEQSAICKVTIYFQNFLFDEPTDVSDEQGEAVSEFSTDPADNSTNYCSMQNLMDGSTLSDAEGYKKFSNKWICPGFDAAKCALL
ncbi:uncharacterized protein LOC112842960 [Oreochromis niloticus]|uniref:uncharacterized protein LOC112842960 n=1 Tax=Oreochromis niloticus TaxID=8128 RepID=UPI000DF24CEB|nr:uncharacterized protein LOC112842960 [Oreochromis niloticus]